MHKKVTDHDIKGSSWLYWNVFVYLLFKTYYQPIYFGANMCSDISLHMFVSVSNPDVTRT